MQNLYFSIFIFLVVVLLSCNSEPTPQKPNVVIFYTDDQGTLDVNCFGSKDLYTPNMNKLAANGVRFTQAYAHTVCCPSRAALLTGRAPQRSNVNQWTQGNAHDSIDGRNMYLEEVTIAEILKEQGYSTGLFGKWHVGGSLNYGPLEQGFDEFYGIRNGFIDNYNHFFLHTNGYHDLWDNKQEAFEEGKYFPDLITQKAIDFIDRKQESPFLLYLGFNIPHYPEQYDEKFEDYYADLEEPRKTYAKIVSTTDDRMGMVMDKIEALGLTDETLFLFISDNGHSTEDYQISIDAHVSGFAKGDNYGANGGGGNTGKWRGAKGSFLEGGVRVPAIISYSKEFPKGAVRDQIVTIMDVLPTICDILDVDLPDRTIDGRSLLPVIENENALSAHKILHFQWFDQWAVREGDWKLIVNGRDNTGIHSPHPELSPKLDSIYLANLSDVKPEEINHAADQRELVKKLTVLHDQWAKNVFSR